MAEEGIEEKVCIVRGRMFLDDCTVCGKPKLLQWVGGDNFDIVCECGVARSHLVVGEA